jgi:gliding motility-associated-like protein
MSIVDLNAGLVAYYPFNGNANDVSGNGHHGIAMNGAKPTTDRFGNANSAFYFDGIDDFVEVLDNGAFGTDHISIALWFRTASQDIQTIIGKENFNTATGAVYQVGINWPPEPGGYFNLVGDQQPPCNQYNSSSNYISGGPMPFTTNQWHCLVVTFDGAIQKIYVDGNLLASGWTDFSAIRKCTTPIHFGNWYNGSQHFKGEMDEIRFYDRALNEEEVLALCPDNPASIFSDIEYTLQCSNKKVSFKDMTQLVNPATPTWYWQFGDGNSSFDQNPTHTYLSAGTYRVKMEVNNLGQKVRVTKDIVIPAGGSIVDMSAGNDTTVCKGAVITLKGRGDGTYAWLPADDLDDPTIATPTVTITQDARFTLTVTATNGCTGSASVEITVRQSPVLNTLQDQTICNLDTLDFSILGGTQYQWSPATGLSDPAVGDPKAYPSTTTQYNVEFQDAYGCVFKDAALITVKPTPLVADAQDKYDICLGNSVKLDLTSYVTGGEFYSWQPATGLSNPSGNAPVAKPTVSTQYIVDISNSVGCHNYDTLDVNVMPLPVLSVHPKENTMCINNSIQVFATGNAVNYSWQPANYVAVNNIPDPFVNPPKDTFMVVTATGANTCIKKDSVKVFVKEHAVLSLLPLKSKLCAGEDVVLTASGGDQYIWEQIPGLSSYNKDIVRANPATTTVYKVKIIESICRDEADLEATITVNQLPNIRVTSSASEINCITPTAQLNATGALTYTWSPGKWLSDSLISAPVTGPADTVTYFITGKDINGCVNQASIFLDFKKIGENKFAFPNAFSPNGDGINDCFGINKLGNIMPNGILRVYNRWGELVFQSSSSVKCWDGTFKGKPVDIGTYVYYLQGDTICGPMFKKGTVTVVR